MFYRFELYWSRSTTLACNDFSVYYILEKFSLEFLLFLLVFVPFFVRGTFLFTAHLFYLYLIVKSKHKSNNATHNTNQLNSTTRDILG
jgi:hypothetical protein